MQSDMKVRALRGLGGLVAALAVVPWLGVGAAQASSGGDDSCATRPAGVSVDASCTLLLGPSGTKVFGETWAVRTSDNHLIVWTFPDLAVGGSESVQLCVNSAAAYPAKHQCNATDADNVFDGSSTTIDVGLDAHGIAPGDAAWWALGVQQGSSIAVSTGGAGAIPTPTATPTTTASDTTSASSTPSDTTSASTTPSDTTSESTSPSHSHSPTSTPTHTHSHSPSSTATPTDTSTGSPSPSVSDTTTSTSTPSTTASSSVLPTKLTASASTSVLGTKLAQTGGGNVGSALALSLALLGLGGILLVGAQTVPAAARRRH